MSDGVKNGIGRKWKRSDSSDSDFLFSLRRKRFYNSAYDSDFGNPEFSKRISGDCDLISNGTFLYFLWLNRKGSGLTSDANVNTCNEKHV